MYKKFLYIGILLSGAVAVSGQQIDTVYNLENPIVVTASQIPTAFADVARTVRVLQAAEIQRMPVTTIQDAIEYIAGVDVQQRGVDGIQADVSIRGATYEQTLVMVDGVKLSDAQTGHHNMNIPVALQDIERIEVLKGPASRHLGPNAFGGVINIITRNGSTHEGSLQVAVGGDGYYAAGASLQLPVGKTRNRVSVRKSASDGYRKNTDFERYSVSLASAWDISQLQSIDFLYGLNQKAFGANSFYTARFPMQWEETATQFAKLAWRYKSGGLHLQSRLHYRYNQDEFLLERDNPAFYRNMHYTHAMGADVHASWITSLGISAIGLEWQRESIESSNLGNHQRIKSGLFLEQHFKLAALELIASGSIYQISDWGWNVWPGLDIKYNLNPRVHLFASLSKAFRVPTFTELYYRDPANAGNDQLQEESAWIYEIGSSYRNAGWQTNLSLFRRDTRRLIDWVWQPVDSLWQVQNLFRVNAIGFEAGLNWRAQRPGGLLSRVGITYTYMDAQKDLRGAVSKYALSYMRQQGVLGLSHRLFVRPLQARWQLRLEDRRLYGRHALTDVRFSWTARRWQMNFDINNVFDYRYEDYFNIPMPGRTLRLSVRWQVL